MAALEDRVRLLILAHLKSGHSPRECAEKFGVSYPTVIKLRKDLIEAEEFGNVKELFNMDEAALELMMEAVQANLVEQGVGELVTEEELEESFKELSADLRGLDLLNQDMQKAATALVKQITILACASHSSDTVLNLAEALAKLQTAFFQKGTNVQIANFNGTTGKFENFLEQ